MKSARQQTILALLARHDTLTTASLAEQLGISKETLRRDLTALQAQGKIGNLSAVTQMITDARR